MNSEHPKSIKDLLLDPDGPRDIYIPPRRTLNLKLRNAAGLFNDEPEETLSSPSKEDLRNVDRVLAS